MTKIKICGITRPEDAFLAAELGADALGFVFFEKSKRYVTADNIAWIKQIPSFIQTVGLFVNPTADFVSSVTNILPIDLLQFHGRESSEFCNKFSNRYIKAVPMQGIDAGVALEFMNNYKNSTGFLLDNYGTTEIGGSGHQFDWSQIPNPTLHQHKIIMAGGLTPGNVSEVIAHSKPWGVDVSSGVEISPGIKSAEKMADFIAAIN